MRRRLRAVLAVALIGSSSAGLPAAAQDGAEPVWPQFQGGPGHPGILSDGPAPPYRVRWTLPAPEGPSLSGAVIVEDVAITVGQGAVYGVDVATGSIAWEVPRAGGPLSVPAVATGNRTTLLYLEGPDDAARAGEDATPGATASPASPSPSPEDDRGVSVLVALDLADRTERWRTSLEATSRTGVTVDGDAAYVGDEDGNVYAIALRDGSVRWTAGLREGAGDPDATGQEAQGCQGFAGARVDVPLAVADDRVIAIGRNVAEGAVAVSAHTRSTGECLWREFPQIGSGASSAAAAGDGIVVVGLADRLVRGLGGEAGEQRWSSLALSFFSPVTSPAFGSGTVYVADLGGGLYRLDARDGTRDWGYQFNEVVVRSSPVVSGDAVLLGLNDGRLVAVDAASGHLVWESAASPGLVGTIALSRDAVVAVKGGRDAGLIAFENDPDGRLVDVPTPTELDPATTLSRVAVASAILLAVVLVPGILLRRRFGDPFADREDEDALEAEEP